MKLNDTIKQKTASGDAGRIIMAPRPPKKWTVEFTSGRRKTFTKSFLKKYYEVIS